MNLFNVGHDKSELDTLSIMRLRSVPDQEAADALAGRLRELERQYKRGFVERGLVLLEVEERDLWRLVDDAETGQAYTSLDRFIVGEATHSRSDCFAALKAVKELRDVPTDKLLDMPRCNVGMLQLLSKSIRKRPEIIAAAQSQSARHFIRTIQDGYPEQHIEERKTIHLSPVKSAKTVIDRAIEMAMVLEDLTTREAVIEAWSVSYIEENKEAYARVMKERA